MLAAGSLARGLRRRGASPASDSNARAIHADTDPPGYRKPSDRPPERRAPVRFGLASPLRYLFLSSLPDSPCFLISTTILGLFQQAANDWETPLRTFLCLTNSFCRRLFHFFPRAKRPSKGTNLLFKLPTNSRSSISRGLIIISSPAHKSKNITPETPS